MIEKSIKEWLQQFTIPSFFDEPLPDGLDKAHEYVIASLKRDTTTVTMDIPQEFLIMLEEKLKKSSWTVNETIVLYLMWSVCQPVRRR